MKSINNSWPLFRGDQVSTSPFSIAKFLTGPLSTRGLRFLFDPIYNCGADPLSFKGCKNPRGQALEFSVKSGLPGGCENVAVQTRAKYSNLLSVDLVYHPHYWPYNTSKNLEIHQAHPEMPAPKTPVSTPVQFFFDHGDIQLTSVIDPETKQHLVTCDLCSQVINLGRGYWSNFSA